MLDFKCMQITHEMNKPKILALFAIFLYEFANKQIIFTTGVFRLKDATKHNEVTKIK